MPDGYFFDEGGEYVTFSKQRWDVISKFGDTFMLLKSFPVSRRRGTTRYVLVEPRDDVWNLLAYSAPRANWRAALLRFRHIAETEIRKRANGSG
jgi:hypothetical protein